jgi:hypothetical protein
MDIVPVKMVFARTVTGSDLEKLAAQVIVI